MPPPSDPPKEQDKHNEVKHVKERSALDDSDIELLKSFVS